MISILIHTLWPLRVSATLGPRWRAPAFMAVGVRHPYLLNS